MQNTNTQEILSDLIDMPETQMRRDINRDELHVLSENIKANGLISPITVRPVGSVLNSSPDSVACWLCVLRELSAYRVSFASL